MKPFIVEQQSLRDFIAEDIRKARSARKRFEEMGDFNFVCHFGGRIMALSNFAKNLRYRK